MQLTMGQEIFLPILIVFGLMCYMYSLGRKHQAEEDLLDLAESIEKYDDNRMIVRYKK